MFKKPFKVISNSQLKGSERKKLRAEILSTFTTLTDETLQTIIPNKELIVSVKILTQNEEHVTLYLVQKLPLLFEVDKVIYPTVYMLWSITNLIPTLTTWPQVFQHISNGADLMLPGVILNGNSREAFGDLKLGDRVAVNLTTNKAPIAIGCAAMTSEDMYTSRQKGRAVHILHSSGDCLWAYSKKMTVPELGPPILNSTTELLVDDQDNLCQTNPTKDISTKVEEEDFSNLTPDETQMETIKKEITNLDVNDAKDNTESISNETKEEEDSTKVMDDLLDYCFYKAWRTSAKKLNLPVLTSNFFKLHMIPACPSGKTLDIKKSSYKKLSKYLTKMVNLEIIKMSETKGVASIVSINENHPLIKKFIDFEPKEPIQMNEVSSLVNPEIQEMYVVTAAVLPVLGHFDARKGESFPPNTIRKYITEYIRKEKLQNPCNREYVKLDDNLKGIVRDDSEEVTWEKLYKHFFANMTHSYKMTVPGQKAQVTKGKLEPIDISIAKRAGNKKVTLVNNLQLYKIDLKDFARSCQYGVAASTSISNVPGRKTPQLLIQGNQVAYVGKLLLDAPYKIEKKNIRGLELALKEKKSNK